MKIRLALAPALALCTLLAACATPVPVTQLDKDTYVVVASSRWSGNDGVAAEGLEQADAWCRKMGRQVRITGSERSEGLVGVLPPKVMLSFKCDPVRQ